ncbi:hypothetical protein CHS0354_000211 [Potamilus streckersoni]|uniref:F-box domain-containing protein n=1 Tax=Potamilus streckersoni TaxID=2493646 RepID=A0AAE0RQM7_9BIVA|nr:hypothetical protein CHS0354_000211 [Potamilus streckersoni]
MEMEEGGGDFAEVMELPPEISNTRFTGPSGNTVITSTPHFSDELKQTAYEKMCLTNDSGFGDTSSLSHSPFPITTNFQIRRRLQESCTSDWDSSQIASPFFNSPDVNTLSLHVDMDIESENERHPEKCINERLQESPDNINMKEFNVNFSSIMQSVSLIETNIQLDRVIGRKMGLEKLDIMTELHIRNVRPVSDVLMQMHPEDLCRMCRVNQTWKTICETDISANQRRLKFLKERKPPSPAGSEKENYRNKMRLFEQRGITDTGGQWSQE